jgi:hypothetical protein
MSFVMGNYKSIIFEYGKFQTNNLNGLIVPIIMNLLLLIYKTGIIQI